MWRRFLPVALTAAVLALVSALALASPGQADHGGGKVKIYDDCDPATFNAAVGAGTCVTHRHGDDHTTFDAFIAEIAATQQAKDWRFDPTMLTTRAGRPVILENKGGETHTFTLVKQFGGGFIDVLNQLSHNPVPAPECATGSGAALVPTAPSPVNVFVAADKEAAFKTAGLAPGKYMFQCCIHPWMRVVLTVK